MASSTISGAQPPSAHTKQYVFVDEYNRHKRLKVMRACDGCRKRKIRCDGALQNGPWPCGACVRLKLKCIPPTLDQEEEPTTPDSAVSQHQFSFQTTSFPMADNALDSKQQSFQHPHTNMVQEWASRLPPPASISAAPTSAPIPLPPLDFDATTYASQSFPQPMIPRVSNIYPDNGYYGSPTESAHFQQAMPQMPSLLRSDTLNSVDSAGDPSEIDAGVRELTENLGEFRIESTSEAPYMAIQKKVLADTPAVEEPDIVLPQSVTTDSTVRIPPEMMPSDDRAMDYFGYYFEHVHPYVPVLNRAQFYEQWRNDRSTISPLLLEGIFACVSRYLEEPVVAKRWLALASRHEESFKDVPRLSTLQATILLLKARESLSKRGYYWRSWMAVKYMCTMSIDLNLHEHYDFHRSGNTCTLPRSECMVRTRIWQTLFALEIIVGAPMGRNDFTIEPETVQFTLPLPSNEVDGFEHETSRRFTYLAQAVHNIKISNILWQKTKRLKKDWALDLDFVRHNADLPEWLKNLPIDMQIHYPEDGSPPWIGSDHFVAYLHSYHNLVVIMHHRPQLQAMLERRDPGFKAHLDICLHAATQMCRIQEALHRDFGFHGLQFMQRGINFTIYCVLTCTMLHLAAITSPDPMLNSQARLYFPRHMRVVEHCLPYSSPEMQIQINALRDAFSVDTSKPFELKPTLGLRSPAMESHPSPPSTNSGPTSAPMFQNPGWSNNPETNVSRTMTPSGDFIQPFDNVTSHATMTSQPNMSFTASNYDVPPSSRTTYTSQNLSLATATATNYALDHVNSNDPSSPVWDPSGIFNSWNTAFGGVPQPSTPQASDPRSTPTAVIGQAHSPTIGHAVYAPQSQLSVGSSPSVQEAPIVPAVTPVMWQDAFTSAFVSGHGQKRYREASVGDHSAAFMTQYPPASKRRA